MFAPIARREAHAEEDENYFISMTDMMVGMLVIFIIVLMAFALNYKGAQDKQETKIQDVREAIQTLVNEVNDIRQVESRRTELLRELKRRLADAGVTVRVDEQSGVLRLSDERGILFDFGSAELKPEGIVAIGHLARALEEVVPCYSGRPEEREARCGGVRDFGLEAVFIEGHTDRVGTERYNLDLSARRAISTYKELVTVGASLKDLKNLWDQPLLSVSGYAYFRPISLEEDKRNRRIDLRFIMSVSHERALLRIKRELEEILTR